MPVAVADSSTVPGQIRYRKAKSLEQQQQQPKQPICDTDPNPPQIPSIAQSSRCKSTISSLLLSTFTPSASASASADNPPTTSTNKKKNFTSATFMGLGCTASSQVSVPEAIRASANWEAKRVRKKKQRKDKSPISSALSMAAANTTNSNNHPPMSSASCVAVPDVWCGPGIGFTTDAASVDCVVSRRPVSGRGKLDLDKMNQRERERERERERFSCPVRRMVTPEDITFLDPDHPLGISRSRLDGFAPGHHRHFRHRSPDGLAEIVMFQSGLMMGGRLDGVDRYRDWRLDVDNMSYEELLELGDRIGYVSTGLREDEIIRCLRKTKLSISDVLPKLFPSETEKKCSICQEEYEEDDEMGKLNCGHFFHINCIKHWLGQKNACPICKTEAVSQC